MLLLLAVSFVVADVVIAITAAVFLVFLQLQYSCSYCRQCPCCFLPLLPLLADALPADAVATAASDVAAVVGAVLLGSS